MSNEVILRFLADTAQLEAAYSRVAGKTTALNRTLSSIGAFGTVATKTGRSLMHGVTAPVLAMATAAGVLGYKWDQTWTRIKSLTNLTATEVGKAKQQVLGLASTGVAPQKLAEGFYYLASAGLSTQGALDALDASAKGAEVGLGDFSALSMTVAGSMNVWKTSNLTAAQSVDIMIAAVKAGTMEPAKMATNLGKVAGQAAAVGMTMSETAGAMASMTNAGLAVEASAVGLGQIINHLTKPTKAAQGEADRLGLSFDKLKDIIQKKGLVAALTEVQAKTHGNDKSIRTLLANQQGVRAYYALMRNGGKDTAGVMRQMSGSTGELGKALKETAASPAHKMQVALASIKRTGIEWGAVLLPKVAELMAHISKLANKLSAMSPQQKETVIRFLAIAAAIGPVLYGVGKLASGFTLVGKSWRSAGYAALILILVKLYATNNNVRDAVNGVVVAIAKCVGWLAKHKDLVVAVTSAVATYTLGMKLVTAAQLAWTLAEKGSRAATVALAAVTRGAAAAMAVYRMGVAVAAAEGKAFTVASGLMAVAQWALNASLLACPVTWVVAAIAVLVGAFVYAWRNSETFRDKVKDAWITIQQVTGATIHAIMPLIRGWVNLILTEFQVLVEGAVLLVGWVPGVGPKLKEAAEKYGDFKDAVLNKMQDIGDDAATWGHEVGVGYAHGLRTSSPGLLAAAATQSKAVKDAYADPDKYFREYGRQNVDAYAKGMKDRAEEAKKTAAKIASQTAAESKQRSETLMFDAGRSGSAKYGFGISSGVQYAKGAGTSLGTSAFNGAKYGPPTGWERLGADAASGYARGINNTAHAAFTAAANLAKKAAAALQKAQDSNSPSKVTMALGKDMGDGYRIGISKSEAGIVAVSSGIVAKLTAQLKKAKDKVASETQDVYAAKHPKHGKANPTTVRHQEEQLKAAKQNAANIAHQLAIAKATDAKVNASRIKFFPELGTAEQMLRPWLDMAAQAEGPISKAANAMAASITKHFADAKGQLPAAVAKMRDQLTSMAKDAADLHQSVFDNLVSGASLTSAFSGKDASAADMKLFLANKVRDMQELGTDLTALSKRGIPTSLLKQFALAGTDAIPMMRSLLGSSSADFAAIVSSQRRVDQLANSTASTVESAVYGARSGTAQSLSIGNVTVQLNVPQGTDGKALASDLLAELKALGGVG